MNASNTPPRRLIIVSYRLPFKTTEKDGARRVEQSSGGLVSAILSLSNKPDAGDVYRNVVWVGAGEGPLPETMPAGDSAAQITLAPVTLDEDTNRNFYGGFCNDLLWPLFHYFPSLVKFDERYFAGYVAANQAFAEKVAALAQPDDLIWIHDYHLFLLPALLRNQIPAAQIAFFLHIPFPTFELFRTMPRRWAEALLKGVLGADLIGFHTYDYCQYFLRSVARLLGYEISMNSVAVEDRIVRADAYPIGIDYEKFNSAAARSPEVEAERLRISAGLQNRILIFSVDRLDYSKGFLHRLAAFACFLETHPEWREKVLFHMVVVPSRDTIASYQDMKHEIEAEVGRINGKYGNLNWLPILYQYTSLSFPELVALYNLSDVGLITPLRDGMNLVAKEFIASQTQHKGMLVLSETAGAAAELCEALTINPTDEHEVAEAICQALTMSELDRTILISRMQNRIRRSTVFAWAGNIFNDLAAVKREQAARKVNLLTSALETQLVAAYRRAARRWIFIDYDGTLVPFALISELATPNPQTLAQLHALAADPKNHVVIISGRAKDFMEQWLGALAVYLIAEHGAFVKAPGGPWQCAIDQDQTWKETILPVLQEYLDRCKGSLIEEKFASLAWHYRNSPEDLGALRAKELTEALRNLVALEHKLQVLEGNKVIEVKRAGYDKGLAAAKLIAEAPGDVIFALGDDKTDEDMFHALPPEALTIKIGLTPSLAKYNLVNQRDVARFIGKLLESDTEPAPRVVKPGSAGVP